MVYCEEWLGAHESVEAALLVEKAGDDEEGKNEIGSKDGEGLRHEKEPSESLWVEHDQRGDGKEYDVERYDSERLGSEVRYGSGLREGNG